MPRPKKDQLELLRAAAELWDAEEQEVGYLAQVFTQTNLPYRDPGDVPAWGRRNGDLVLVVRPGMTMNKEGAPQTMGYPYGTYPRLLLSWLSTEAVRTKSPELELGANLSEFMRTLHNKLKPTGGKTGSITRLRDQMVRLFNATLSVQRDGVDRQSGGQLNIASAYDLWWTTQNVSHLELKQQSKVRLSAEFFEEVTRRPVPLDLGALAILGGSAMRLDIYAWLTYRMSYLRRTTTVPWQSLREQFGSNLADTKQGRAQFKRDFIKNLAEVLVVYRDAQVDTTPAGVVLRPSRTHVPFRGLRSLGT